MLNFDAKTTAFLERVYLGADITRRRRASFDACNLRPGDRVLDIGCGNGMLTAELARAVGPQGRVTGIDPSADMRAAAAKRCAEFDWVELRDGVAAPLPVEDGSVDRAVSVQVFEYLPDIPAACDELARVLRPGGLVAIGDMHFGTLVWHSDDPARMDRMLSAYATHLVEPAVPALLPRMLQDAGLEVERVVPVPFSDHELRPDGLAAMMHSLVPAYCVDSKLVEPEEAKAWKEEQTALAADGRFFFSITHFVVVARRP